MNTSLQIKNLTRDDILTHLDALAGILENCVNGGASVSFMLPFSLDKARSFWRGIAESVGRNERLVLACVDPQDGVIGTVQLIVDQPENQPHRADVAKLLVHEKARRKGAAMALMEALEAEAGPEIFRFWCSIPPPAAAPRRSTSVPAGKRWGRSRAMP